MVGKRLNEKHEHQIVNQSPGSPFNPCTAIDSQEGAPVLKSIDTIEAPVRSRLLEIINKKIDSVSHLSELVQQIVSMTQHTLNSEASSVLLLDESTGDLYFEVAEGDVSGQLKRIRLNPQDGIAGWVIQHRRPLIVNGVTRDERFNRIVDSSTGFATKSIVCVPLVVHQKMIGVLEVLNKCDGSDFSEQDQEILSSVAATAAIAIENTKLHDSLVDSYKNTLKALAATIDAKDPYTFGHSERVRKYALLGGIALSMSSAELEALEAAAILHDIGKIGIPDSLLSKSCNLTYKERQLIHQHPKVGANIVKDIPFLREARLLILHHHERYDGTGYPDGLEGDTIPIGARLLAVVDAFDAITTARSYRPAISMNRGLDELKRGCGTQFCPVAVHAFTAALERQSVPIGQEVESIE